MRVLILGDMEGVAGICRWEHVLAEKALYEEGRRLYTGELNAAVRGAKQAGATDITVVDTHGAGGARSFNSVVREELDSGCRYCTQHRWLDFESLLKQGYQAAAIVGMHAMAGTPDGVLAHTASYDTWMGATVNWTPIGETAILAALCGHYACPTVFVSGDEATCREAEGLLGGKVVTAAVKRGLNKFGALHLTPQDSCDLIQARVAEALGKVGTIPIYSPPEPCTVQIQFTSPEIVSYYERIPGVERAGNCGIEISSESWYTVWKLLFG